MRDKFIRYRIPALGLIIIALVGLLLVSSGTPESFAGRGLVVVGLIAGSLMVTRGRLR